MKKPLCILLLLSALLSCEKQEKGTHEEQDGGLRITLGSGRLGTWTRADVPGDGEIADGGGIYIDRYDPGNPLPDVVIMVANSKGDIVAKYPGENASLEPGALTTDMSILFDGLEKGSYSVYAVGNTEGLWAMDLVMPNEEKVENVSLDNLTTVAQLEHLQFQEHYVHMDYDPNEAPDPEEVAHRLIPRGNPVRIPVSAKATNVAVSADGNGHAELEMLRCVAKVTVEFRNLEDYPLHLSDTWFRINDICVCQGYVFPHGGHAMPPGTHHGTLVDQTNRNDDNGLTIEANGSFSRSFYVHPATAPDPPGYFSMTVHLNFDDMAGHEDETFPNMPIFTDHREDVFTLDRNEHLHIVCTIAAGNDVSFNFRVIDWEGDHSEVVSFD